MTAPNPQGDGSSVDQKAEVAAYLKRPSDASFQELLKKAGDSIEPLIDVLYPSACATSDAAVLTHFTALLAEAGRSLEASFFSDRLLAAGHESVAVHRLAAAVACQRGDIGNAQRSFRWMQDHGASNGLLFLIETIMLLVCNRIDAARETARAMIAEGCDDPMWYGAALQAAITGQDGALLSEVLLRGGRDPGFGKRNENRARQILAASIVDILRRAGKPEGS